MTEAKTLDRINRAFKRNPYWTEKYHPIRWAKHEAYACYLLNAQMKESLQLYDGMTVADLVGLAKEWAEAEYEEYAT